MLFGSMKITPTVYAIIILVVLVGVFLVLRSRTQSSTLVPSPAATSSALANQTKTFELVVNNRKLTSGPETIKVTEGDNVVIKITADEDEELHLHGYDKSVDLTKNVPAELSFTANLTGRFSYELEKSKKEIGALEVSPK